MWVGFLFCLLQDQKDGAEKGVGAPLRARLCASPAAILSPVVGRVYMLMVVMATEGPC